MAAATVEETVAAMATEPCLFDFRQRSLELRWFFV
jgi:hypothetical protein